MPHAVSPDAKQVVGMPWHPLVLGLPLACFGAALLTDIAYAQTFDVGWKNFSDWLLAGGMLLGALAAIVGIVDLARSSVRGHRLIWPYAIAYAVAMVLGLFDNLVHSRDAYGVMPAGLVLSLLTVLALAVAAVLGILLLRGTYRSALR